MEKDQIVGVFDSGVGGLTVARSIYDNFSFKKLIYFGDLAHLPYGDKSEAAIQAFSIRISDFLQKKGCKTIVIACNSASASSATLLREFFRDSVKIINVIDPMVEYVATNYKNKKIGLIGTKRTIDSRVYFNKINSMNKGIELVNLPTPLLVPMIEEGFIDGNISKEIIASYLSNPIFNTIEALILGCTHYPLIKEQISNFFGGRVDVIDSTKVIVNSLNSTLPPKHDKSATTEFFVSDYTKSFEKSGKYFFGEKVHLKLNDIWP